ncbi:CIPK25 [Symbiodinium sp. KB8]|nr:CIPK25 [Symbiodinium sp. KB8]
MSVSEYEFLNVVGEGGFGTVHRAKHRRTGEIVAIKSISKDKLKDEEALQMEVEFLKLLASTDMRLSDHPNTVRYYETFEDAKDIHLVMELCSGGSLAEYIENAHDSYGPGVSEDELARIAVQILKGIAYCHAHSVAHRDIKPQNLLFSCGEPAAGSAIPIACSGEGDAPLKLVDFGIAGVVRNDRPEKRLLTKCAGTVGYMAPEVFGSKPYDGRSADMFSIGAVIHHMMVGLPPSWKAVLTTFQGGFATRGSPKTAGSMKSRRCGPLLQRPSDILGSRAEASICKVITGIARWRGILVRGSRISCFEFVELGRKYSSFSSTELRHIFATANVSKSGQLLPKVSAAQYIGFDLMEIEQEIIGLCSRGEGNLRFEQFVACAATCRCIASANNINNTSVKGGLTAATKKSPAPSMSYMTGTTGLGTLSGLSMAGFSTPSPAKTNLLNTTTSLSPPAGYSPGPKDQDEEASLLKPVVYKPQIRCDAPAPYSVFACLWDARTKYKHALEALVAQTFVVVIFRSTEPGASMMFSRAILVAALVQAVAAAKEARMSVSANGGVTLFQKRSIGGKVNPALLQGQSKLSRSEAVRLRTYDGKHLHSDGKKVWVSTENAAKTEVLLRSVGSAGALNTLQSGDAVLLETREGNRLEILGGTVNVRPKNYRQDSQTFLVQRQGGDGDLEDGDPSFLVSGTGHVLAVEGGKVLARKPDMDTGEAFLLERAASHKPESQWLVVPNPQGHCDPTLQCHRKLNVSCRSADGADLSFDKCDHHSRPWSYEPCFRSPLGSCIDLAESDCVDIPGMWWNTEGKTCAQYGVEDCDNELVHRACRQTCGGGCQPAKTLTSVADSWINRYRVVLGAGQGAVECVVSCCSYDYHRPMVPAALPLLLLL